MNILIIVGLIIGIFVIIGVVDDYKFKKNAKIAIEKQNKLNAQKRKEFQEQIEEMDAQLGKCVKSLCKDKYGNDLIRVYEDAQVIVINGKQYGFADLLKCEAWSSTSKDGTPTPTVTKTDKGNMALRAAVGGALLGPAGAIVGAMTAKKVTKVDEKEESRRFQEAMNDYLHRTGGVTVYLKSISKPEIGISCFKNEENSICSLINAIIAVCQSDRN